MKNQGTIFAVVVALVSMVIVTMASHSSIKKQGEDYKEKYELAIERINAKSMEINNLDVKVSMIYNDLLSAQESIDELSDQVATAKYKIDAQEVVINEQSDDLESFKVFTKAILKANYSK